MVQQISMNHRPNHWISVHMTVETHRRPILILSTENILNRFSSPFIRTIISKKHFSWNPSNLVYHLFKFQSSRKKMETQKFNFDSSFVLIKKHSHYKKIRCLFYWIILIKYDIFFKSLCLSILLTARNWIDWISLWIVIRFWNFLL